MIVKRKTLKIVLWILADIFVFVNIFALNVAMHEAGHYLAAEYYGLEPEIKFELEKDIFSFSFQGTSVASTSFVDNGNKEELTIIALMGPFINLVLGVIFLVIFVLKKNDYMREIALISAVVSLGSFIMNILPIEGIDGSLIFGVF